MNAEQLRGYLSGFADDADAPDWDEFDRAWKHVHDWRTHIPKELREAWPLLTANERRVAIACCQQAADGEDWD